MYVISIVGIVEYMVVSSVVWGDKVIVGNNVFLLLLIVLFSWVENGIVLFRYRLVISICGLYFGKKLIKIVRLIILFFIELSEFVMFIFVIFINNLNSKKVIII